MKPVEINQRIQFHTEQAQRLLQSDPLIREYLIHAQRISELQSQLSPRTARKK